MSLRDDCIFSQRQATLLGETGKAANSYKMCGEFGKTNGFAARIFVMGMAALASPSGGGASVRTLGRRGLCVNVHPLSHRRKRR